MGDELELDTEEAQTRNFATEAIELMAQQRSGTLLAEIGEGAAEIGRRIRERGGGSGKLTVVLDFRTATKGGGKALSIAATVKVTTPKAEVEETLMYVSEDGKLSRRDPRQPELPL